MAESQVSAGREALRLMEQTVVCAENLNDLKPELEQFAVNARRAPERIFDAHPPDRAARRTEPGIHNRRRQRWLITSIS
jgi:hypothetical protein